MASTLELLHQIIRRQTNILTMPVTNLYGTVAGTEPTRPAAESGVWRLLSVNQEVSELEAFYSAYQQSNTALDWLESAVQGAVVYPHRSGLDGGSAPAASRRTYMAIGTVCVNGSLIVPLALELDSQQSWAAVYVDGVLQRRAWGKLDLRISLTAGPHQIVLLISATQFGLAVPESVCVTADDIAPATTWDAITSVTDPVSGVSTVTLSWYNSARAGGWLVFRRVITPLAEVASVVVPSTSGVFRCDVTGNYVAGTQAISVVPGHVGTLVKITLTGHGFSTGDVLTLAGFTTTAYNGPWTVTVVDVDNFTLDGSTWTVAGTAGTVARTTGTIPSAGTDVYVGDVLMGRLVSVRYEATTGTTHLEVQLASSLAGVNVGWVGLMVGTAQISALARVQRLTGADKVTWDDTGVVPGAREYALQAFGLFDESVRGPLSEYLFTTAGDITPPGAITFAAGYPQILNRKVAARFTTPSDTDYAGVHVYYEDVWNARITTGPGTGLDTLADTSNTWTRARLADGILQCEVTFGDLSVGVGSITGMSGDQLTVNSAWMTPITANRPYRILRHVPVITDYGLPSSLDEFTFELLGTGVYQFRAFDLSGNEQLMGDCATWTLAATEPPLTTLTTQDIDATGASSSLFVGVTLGCYPGFAVLSSGTVTSGSAYNTLVGSGGVGGMEDYWASIDADYIYRYVRVISAIDGSAQVRKIGHNTASTLTLLASWDVIPVAGDQYDIVDGATLRQWNAAGGFLPVSEIMFKQREATPLLLDFYSELTGFPAEAMKRVLIDVDTSPSCTITAVEDPACCLRVCITPDDDVREWWMYARKGRSPLTSDKPDEQYLRFQRPVSVPEVVMSTASASGDVWYVSVLPVSSLTEFGEPVSATITLRGAASSTPMLSDIAVDPVTDGSLYYNRVKWNHNTAVDGSTTVTIYAYRSDRGAGSKAMVVSSRAATADSTDYNNAGDTSTVPNCGSAIHQLAGIRGGSTSRTWNYEIELWQYGSKVTTYSVARSESLVDPWPTVGVVTAEETEAGTGSNNDA